MCGLAFAVSKRGKNTGEYIYSLFEKQKTRGQQGFGFMCINEGKLTKVFRAKWAPDIKKELADDKSDIILFHHRFPTSTKNTLGTTHPIFVSSSNLKYDYYWAHNGVITNADILKKKHNEFGYEYTTEFIEKTKATYKNGTEEELVSTIPVFNDSEALAIELSRWVEGLDEAVNTNGGAAFWGVQLEKGTNNVLNIYWGKNKGRELRLFENKNWFAVSSESGQDVIADMMLYTMSMETYEYTERELPIDEAKPAEKAKNVRYHQPADDDRVVGFGVREDHTPLQLPYASTLGREESILSPFVLKNAWYSYDQAVDTGFPISEFYRTLSPGGTLSWVPQQYMSQTEGRVMLKDYVWDEEKENEKNVGVLDELIEKLVDNEVTIDDLESCLVKRFVTEQTYATSVTRLEQENEELVHKMSALGFSEEFVESRIDTARDVADYTRSYRSEPETELTDADFINIT